MADQDSAPWLNEHEKFALIGLELNFDGDLPLRLIAPELWAMTNTQFKVPPHWREWLGSVRVEEVEGCNLFLLSKVASSTSGVLDGENQTLQQLVWHFYFGLPLTSTFSPSHRPVMLTD